MPREIRFRCSGSVRRSTAARLQISRRASWLRNRAFRATLGTLPSRRGYWTIFSLLTLVVVLPLLVTFCSTSIFFALASFLANFFFGFSETIFDLPALTLAL